MNYDSDNNEENYETQLKPGTFRARAINAGLGESSNGNPQVAVMFQILNEGFEGETIPWYGSFSKTLGKGKKTPFQRTIEALRACGWEGDDISDLSTVGSSEVSLVLDYEVYEGKRQLRVKWVNRPGGGLALKTPLNETQAKAFAAKMKGEIIAASRAIPPANGNPGKPPRRDEDPMQFPPSEDDY